MYREYNLIGVLMGLAVYNSIILDLHFPSICYRKLLTPPVVPQEVSGDENWAIVAQAKFSKLGGRSQPREAKLEELSLEIRNYLLIPSSLRLLS